MVVKLGERSEEFASLDDARQEFNWILKSSGRLVIGCSFRKNKEGKFYFIITSLL